MRILGRPLLWVVSLAALLAVTIGGPTFSTLGPLSVDNPEEDALFQEIEEETAVALGGGDQGEPETAQAAKEGLQAAAARPAEVAVNDPLPLAEALSTDGVGGPTDEEEEEAIALSSQGIRVFEHRVQSGDTLIGIASRYGIDPSTIRASNDLPDANLLRVGQKLNILSTDGALHKVKRGESLWEIARTYQVDMDEIVRMNGLENPSRIRPDQELVIPGLKAAAIGSGLRSEQLISADGRLLRAFSWPVQGRISSRYGPRWGRMHHGIDLAVNTGTPVRAAARGRVSFSGWNGGYGNLVVIDHGNGIETRYAHNSRLVARVGQYVERGDLIAYSGNTGNSTGPHVHFEIRLRGQSVNPLNYLQ